MTSKNGPRTGRIKKIIGIVKQKELTKPFMMI